MLHRHVRIKAPAAEPLPGDNPDMARQQENGLDMSADRVFPDWVSGPNVRFAFGVLIAAGLLYWFPASKGQVELIQQKVEQHDKKDIPEIKESQIRQEKKTDRLGEKMDRLLERSASPAPASPPPYVEKTRPAVHKGSIRKRRPEKSTLKRIFG